MEVWKVIFLFKKFDFQVLLVFGGVMNLNVGAQTVI